MLHVEVRRQGAEVIGCFFKKVDTGNIFLKMAVNMLFIILYYFFSKGGRQDGSDLRCFRELLNKFVLWCSLGA